MRARGGGSRSRRRVIEVLAGHPGGGATLCQDGAAPEHPDAWAGVGARMALAALAALCVGAALLLPASPLAAIGVAGPVLPRAALALSDVRFDHTGAQLRVSATLANAYPERRPAPPLRLVLTGRDGAVVAARTFHAPEGFVPANGTLTLRFGAALPPDVRSARLLIVDGPDAVEAQAP